METSLYRRGSLERHVLHVLIVCTSTKCLPYTYTTYSTGSDRNEGHKFFIWCGKYHVPFVLSSAFTVLQKVSLPTKMHSGWISMFRRFFFSFSSFSLSFSPVHLLHGNCKVKAHTSQRPKRPELAPVSVA